MELRSFTHEDVDEAKELSVAAGWNQTASDWHRIINVQPDGCIGAWEDGQLVGTTTFVTYGKDLAWVGMVLVRPMCQGCGIGTSLVRTAMDMLTEREISVVGLDATEAGRPLYEREGFCDVTPIVRWTGTLRPPAADVGRTEPIDSSDVGAVKRFDRSIVDVDRERLIERLIGTDEVVGFSAYHGNKVLKGYVFLRPGRNTWQVGPLVADHENAVKPLLRTAARFLDGHKVVLDAVESFGFPSLLDEVGLEPDRRLMRMTAPRASHLLTRPSIIATAGFEWG